MEHQLHLKKSHQDLLWKRRAALEAKFKVKIHPLFLYSNNQGTKNGGNDCNGNEMCVSTLEGEISDTAALKKYVKEVLVQPEIIEIVSYLHDLEAIFQNPVWIEIFEEFFSVCITVRPDCELNVSGTESSVQSAVSVFEEIIAKYCESKDTLCVSNERSLALELVTALRACKNVHISTNPLEVIPNDVIKLLLSLLEKAYEESYPGFVDPESLDDSVVIIDPPVKKSDVSVIILDSDSDSDINSKRPLESCSSENLRKKKKKLRERKLKKKKSRALENVNGAQGGGELSNLAEQPNGNLQCLKIENCVVESNLPKVENPNFIPLSIDSKIGNSSTSEIIPQQAGPSSGEVQVKDVVDVFVEDIPKAPRQLRPVIIDGCNVAFYATQGRREDFSWKRIETCLKHFLNRGHDVKVFLPQYRRPLCYEKSGNQEHIENLETKHQIIFTPSRRIDGRTVSCYDDRFIVDLASRNGGIIFSNDNYRDLINENSDFAKTIKERLLMYLFVGDELMIPEDPLGKSGPRLDEFLCFPPENEK